MRVGLDTVEEFWDWKQVEHSYKVVAKDSLESFRADFGQFLKVDPDQIRFMPSGHQGLEWLLRGLSDSRRTVMAPAFNCSVVQDGIEAAGYKAKLYDFSAQPGLFDWEKVIQALSPSVGVLIVTHYFGVPTDFCAVAEYCSDNDITIIEDCAHTLGGSINSRTAGTIGDAAIFSFNYDKPVSLGWGGIVLVNNSLRFNLHVSMDDREPAIDEEFSIWQQFVAAMAYRRKMISKQSSLALRVLRRARLVKSKQFCKAKEVSVGAIQAELGRWCMQKYPEVLSIRNANAQRLADAVPQPSWPLGESVTPAWVKQKIYIEDMTALEHLSKRLQRRGLRVGNFNWPALLKSDNASNYPVAQQAATHWVDVPVHQNLRPQHLDEIIAAFREVA